MVIIQDRSLRKSSGGRNKSTRSKRVHMAGHSATLPIIDDTRLKTKKQKGGSTKTLLLATNIANVYDPKTKKHYKTGIKVVAENKANRNYVRRNILTKNTIINTEKGKARITNRPGQENIINAVLLNE